MKTRIKRLRKDDKFLFNNTLYVVKQNYRKWKRNDEPYLKTYCGELFYLEDLEIEWVYELHSKYILISYTFNGPELNPHWDVFGHIGPGNNELIHQFDTEEEALKFGIRYSTIKVPLLRSAYPGEVVKRLSHKP